MPLIETLIGAVGPAIAKKVVKLWAGDSTAEAEAGGLAVDTLAKLIPEIRARKEAERQIEEIGERAAESLRFIFETEGKQLMVDDQEAVATLVAQTLDRSKISVELLVQKDLDPMRLAHHFITEATEQLSLFPEHRARLFSRVIEEASQSIIDIARKLPNFSERTIAELLRRDRVLIDAAQRTFESLDRIRLKAEDDQQSASARFEIEYRRAVVRNLNRVELFGVDLSRSSRSHPLSVAYVSLEVSDSTHHREDKADPAEEVEEDEEVEETAIHAVELALADTARLLIKGPAGAGKTTLMHWLAVRAASGDFEYPLQEWNATLPFVIRLRQSADPPLPGPEKFPSLVAPAIADTMEQGWVHQELNSGRAVVMVDGVDEVAEHRREEVRKWVSDLVNTFPRCRFIVTSRPHAVEEHWLAAAGFEDAHLQPMDSAGIEAFIDHWHKAVAEEAEHEEEIPALQRLAENLKTTLRSNRGVRRLATNPLLCSVICALHRDTNEQLPEDRLELYERCCSMLLERRDPESGLRITGYPRLSYRQKRSLLDDLAYWMLKNNWSEIPVTAARDRLEKRLEAFRPDERDGAPLNGQSALRFFVERSGILREPLPGRLDFAHRTFQEFMAANAVVGEGDVGVLLSNATDPQWREVVILGAALARQAERATLIRSLLMRKGDGDLMADRAPFLLLAAACLDASVDVDNDIRAEVESRLGELFPPRSLSEAMIIADAAGEMAVPFLRRTGRTNARQSAACVRGLSIIGSPDAIQAIAEYADDYGTVAKEVARAADRIDPAAFLDLIAPRIRPEGLPGDAVAFLIRKFGFENLPKLEDARELSLSGTWALKPQALERLPHLRSLNLTGPRHTHLSYLQPLSELTTLSLTDFMTPDLAPLKGLPSLKQLMFKNGEFDAAQLMDARLTVLSLSGAIIKNPEALQSLRRLERLILNSPSVDPTFLKKMNQISRLMLIDIQIADLSPLSGLHALKYLYVSGTAINDLSPLSQLLSLETLELAYGTRLPESLDLPPLPKLRKIVLFGSQASSELISKFRRTYPLARITK